VAARLAPTVQARRAVVRGAAAITRAAVNDVAVRDQRVMAALDVAEMWAAGAGSADAMLAAEPGALDAAEPGALDAAGAGSADAMLAAELGALDAAASAALRAASQSALARLLLDAGPRRRLSSVTARRALRARLACRAESGYTWAALAAALTVRAAADAGDTGCLPEQWAACVGWAGAYAARALLMAPRAWNDEPTTAAARCAAIVRGCLPCPSVI
jgi:hypothetical protein